MKKESKVFAIPYEQIIDIEYGQKAGRRVGAAIATAILISGGLFWHHTGIPEVEHLMSLVLKRSR
jgi:hypothetical protein